MAAEKITPASLRRLAEDVLRLDPNDIGSIIVADLRFAADRIEQLEAALTEIEKNCGVVSPVRAMTSRDLASLARQALDGTER
jgi:hypothetical protein